MRLSDHLNDLDDRIRRAGTVWVGCDFDGTLAPLVDDPWEAAIDPLAAASVARLAACPTAAVAIISGRALSDIRPRMGLSGVAYAGNHGAEIDAPGLKLTDAMAGEAAVALGTAHHRLAESPLPLIQGVVIDHKTYSLSVDYRAVPPDERGPVIAAVAAAAAGLPTLHVLHGLHGSEVRANGARNKGSAALQLIRHQSGPEAVPIFLGDDRTDEDAFAALPDGVTVCVGDHPTAARYRVSSPADVAVFLDWLAGLCERL